MGRGHVRGGTPSTSGVTRSAPHVLAQHVRRGEFLERLTQSAGGEGLKGKNLVRATD